MTVQRVLVLVDFSEGSDLALTRAAQIAASAGAELTLLHATGPPGVVPEAALSAIVDGAKQQLEKACAVANQSGIEGEGRLHPGAPLEAFEATEAELRPDLVVVGARGHSALHRIWLGSVAEAVVRHASAPVLVVRESRGGAAAYHRFLWATDFSPDAEATVQIAQGICEPGAAGHALHVLEPPYEAIAALGSHAIHEIRSRTREGLDRAAQATGTTPHLADGSPDREIPRMAAKLGCDLIAMGAIGARTDGWLQPGGVTARVVRRSPCSVLVGRVAGEPGALHEDLAAARREIGRALDPGDGGTRSLLAAVGEVSRLARDSRALEDELLTTLAEEISARAALLEAEHPAIAEALSRVVRTLSRMGI